MMIKYISVQPGTQYLCVTGCTDKTYPVIYLCEPNTPLVYFITVIDERDLGSQSFCCY